MKEEATSKKLPPKILNGGTSNNTPTKMPANDEIISTLLRINNFDSISNMKDDMSLDIDLSACVTITADTMGIINGNSLSSTDFWRVLDENAQNSGLDLSRAEDATAIDTGSSSQENAKVAETSCGNSFSGNFLRPEPPIASLLSPIKKTTKVLAIEQQQQQRKTKVPVITKLLESKKLKISSFAIKEEPPEQLLADPAEPNNSVINLTTSSRNKVVPSDSHRFNNIRVTIASTIESEKVCGQNSSIEFNGEASSHLPNQCLYKCIDCDGLILCGQQEYDAHDAISHQILFQCGICDRDFELEAGLKKHLRTHRSVDARKDAWKKCPDCGKCLKLGSMWMHRKIHSDNKKYGCEICGQKFVQKINLTHHSRVHTTEKPYECPECQKRFQERSHLQRHQKYHAQTRSYRCDKCGKMYKTERCLKVHNLVHLDQRPFACNVCDKSFISNSKLKQHSNIHTGERPFKCNYCPRDFTNFPNWLKHTRRRHKVDHKTGEHLENIPSYCSKKSSKVVKSSQKNVEKIRETNVNSDQLIVSLSSANLSLKNENPIQVPKAQTKRKKKINTAAGSLPSLEITSILSQIEQKIPLPQGTILQTTSSALLSSSNNNSGTVNVNPVPTASTDTIATIATEILNGIKIPKLKRERKQLVPKQLQKVTLETPEPLAVKNELYEENIKPKQMPPMTSNHFPDLHFLSITSAEDLIMEQALEMEESGLYNAPVSIAASSVDTDNAISSEMAAALQFKIKNEFDVEIKNDEDVEARDRLLCSSIESSPFSSPASIDVLSSPKITANTTSNTLYLPSFTAMSGHGNLVTNRCSSLMANTSTSNIATTANRLPPLSALQQINSSPQTTESLETHLYFPVAMTVPLLVQPNQMLPSVETLFSSSQAAANGKFFRDKSITQQVAPIQHNI